ncbi:secretin and TonB N-terminal domain-containing protein [uncultured Ilyobacter sp.]|uniref:type II secretion system protein GspD n=1 Tax=uncultured Ilyobacter sp. TaxID=544433 RepID=UPI0029F46CAE|nr:secretin and TonB N-terminal domain-containing protein [uncultured Ilyobacter sp.]
MGKTIKKGAQLITAFSMLGSTIFGAGYNGETIAPDQKVTVDYNKADLVNVLRTLSFSNDLNIVISDRISGTVTMSVKDAQLDDLLEAILRSNGYTYVQSGNLVEIMSLEDAKTIQESERSVSKVFSLKKIDASEVAEDVKLFLKDGDTSVVNAETNSITVRAKKSELISVKNFLDERDGIKKEDVQKNVELIRVKHMTPQKAYEILGEIGYKIAGDIKYSESLGGLIVIASSEEADTLKNIMDKIDVPELQVVIEARILEVQEGTGRDWGMSWGYNSNNLTEADTSDGSGGYLSGTDSYYDASSLSDGITLGLGLLGSDQFSAVYRNVLEDSSTEILAKPVITTLNGKKATIELTEEVPYKELEYVSDSGDATSTSYEFKDVGITLEVTPVITDDGMIKIEVTPEISEVTGYTDDGVPFVSSRKVETNVIVRNGQTLAIGGLIKDTKSTTSTEDPYLSKIPILGYFFKSSNNEKSKTNLMIFITPKIIMSRDMSQRFNLVKGASGNVLKTIKKSETEVRKYTTKVKDDGDTRETIYEKEVTGIDKIQQKLNESN